MTNMQKLGLQLEQASFFVKKKIEIQKKFFLKLKNLKGIYFPKINKKIRHSLG